eukprot:TRINITY_DN1179_c1_g1_i2.p1 TRINITY_DN1179_c1_g1~~TRINITY_DN1179_c1_g1_i2.p1  ORF type:complete len:401 (+),score=77.92 TRINITY_DN1179_c1_g1_i2:55-1257(+)
MLKTAFCALAALASSTLADFVAPEFTVSLDEPAYDRWKPVLDSVINGVGYENSWGKMHAFLQSILTHEEWVETAELWDKIYESYPEEYQQEITAMMKWLYENNHTDWTRGQMVMCQLFYEVEDACTSIVAQNKNGTVFHSRNLDYGLPGLQNFTTTIHYTKGGEKITSASVYLGYLGVLTGQRYPKGSQSASWSISLNQRFYGEHVVPYVDTIKEMLAGVQNVGFTLRDALASDQLDTFKQATDLLRVKPIPAPAYLTMAGVASDEGVVITRDRNGTSKAAGTDRGYWTLDVASGVWYRLETNFDNWEPLTDGRRKAAHKTMDEQGQDKAATIQGLNLTLSTPPVLAPTTIYTASMLNDVGYFNTFVRMHGQESDEKLRREVTASVTKKMKDVVSWWRSQ